MLTNAQGNVVPFDRSAAYWQRRAGDHRRKGHYTRAAVLLRQAAEDKKDASALLELGEMMNQLECWESACMLLTSLIARYPLFGSAYYQLAESLYHVGRKSEAADAYDYALRTAQDDSYYDDAVRRLDLLDEEMDESSRTEFFKTRAIKAFAREEYDESERLFMRALRSSLHRGEVLTSLSVCMGQAGRMEQCLKYAVGAVKQNPSSFRARCALVSALLFMNKPRAAKGMLAEAVKVMDTPADESAFCQVAGMMGQHHLIRQVMTGRLKDHPNRLPILYNLAVSSLLTGDSRQGFELLEHAARMDPDAPWLMAVRQELNALGPDKFLKSTLNYYPMLTPNMLRRQLSALMDMSKKKRPQEASAVLYARLNALFSVGEPSFQQLVLLLFSHIKKDETEDFARQMLLMPGVTTAVQLYALDTLAGMSAKPPFLLLRDKRLMLVDAPLSTKGKSPLFNLFAHALLSFGKGAFPPGELLSEADRVWRFLPPFFRREATGEWNGAWCTGIMMHLYERKKEYKKSAQMLFDSGFSQRKVATIAAVLEALDPNQEVLTDDPKTDRF